VRRVAARVGSWCCGAPAVCVLALFVLALFVLAHGRRSFVYGVAGRMRGRQGVDQGGIMNEAGAGA
jgi:hypothetical protein